MCPTRFWMRSKPASSAGWWRQSGSSTKTGSEPPAFAETSEPEEIMGVLHEYHAEMGRVILAHEGTLERFAGDGMMVFFNDPVPVADAPERAVRMVLTMRDRLSEMTSKWRKRGFDLGFGAGIAQGYATIGAVGFEGRWDYGAIGTVTNVA